MRAIAFFTLILAEALLSACQPDAPPAVLPTASISDVTVAESAGQAELKVSLSSPLSASATFQVLAQDGTAKAGVDYVLPSSSQVTLQPGAVAGTLLIPLNNDHVLRPSKSFAAALAGAPAGVAIARGLATVTILNDNTTPDISFAQPAVILAKAASARAQAAARLSMASSQAVSAAYAVSGSANPLADCGFAPDPGSEAVTFAPFSTEATISGTVTCLPTLIQDKAITLTLESPVGATIGAISAFTMLVVDSGLRYSVSVSGEPGAGSVATSSSPLSIAVSAGSGLASAYEYKVVSSSFCGDGGFSRPFPLSQPIALDPLLIPSGPALLCVIGGDGANFQSAQIATVASWISDASPLALPAFLGVTTPYRDDSPPMAGLGSYAYQSSSAAIAAAFSGLPPGGTIFIYDSPSCQGPSIGEAPASPSLTASVAGAYSAQPSHALSAMAADASGQTSPCLAILASYQLNQARPYIAKVAAAVGSGSLYGAGQVLQLEVTFSANITVPAAPSAPYVILNTQPPAVASYFNTTSGSVAVFNYPIGATDASPSLDYAGASALVVPGGAIADAFGNAAALSLPAPGSAADALAAMGICVDVLAPSAVTGFADGQLAGGGPLSFSWQPSTDFGCAGLAGYRLAVASRPDLGHLLGGAIVAQGTWTAAVSQASFSAAAIGLASGTYYGAIMAVDRAGNASGVTFGNGFAVP